MSRVGGSKTINNFAKGWVTEFNPLNFPANTLQEAMNIVINYDGSIKSRSPFSKVALSWNYSGQADYNQFTSLKHFRFPGEEGIIFAYLSDTRIRLDIVYKGVRSYKELLPPVGNTFKELDKFDIAFLDGSLLFSLQTVGILGNDVQIYKGVYNKATNVWDVSTRKSETTVTTTIRYPETGYIYNAPIPNTQGDYILIVVNTGDPSLNYYSLMLDATVAGGPIVGPFSPMTVTYGGQVRKYYLGEHKLGQGFDDGWEYHYYSMYYTVDYTGLVRTGEAELLSYRDTYGVPHHINSTDAAFREDVRYPNESSFSAYNLYNAGWRWGDSVNYSTTVNGSAVGSAVGSLASATKTVVNKWPCLADSPDFNKISNATSVAALGLYSPHLLDADQPLVGKSRRGTHILTLSGEYAGDGNHNPDLGAYFSPVFTKNKNSVIAGTESATLPLESAFSAMALDISEKSSITAVGYINGRAWYGVDHPLFNLAFSQIRENVVTLSGEVDISTRALASCYQATDPNAPELNNLVDTDGGTASLRDVGKILKIVGYRNYVLLFASNGVWSISSGSGGSFVPTSFSVDKLTTDGITSNQHVIETQDRIYYISKNQLNVVEATTNKDRVSLVVQDISTGTLKQGVANLLLSANKNLGVMLSYDPVNKRVFFNYPSDKAIKMGSDFYKDTGINLPYLVNGYQTLVFDEVLSAFYKWKANTANPLAAITSDPFSLFTYYSDKNVNGAPESMTMSSWRFGTPGFYYVDRNLGTCIYKQNFNLTGLGNTVFSLSQFGQLLGEDVESNKALDREDLPSVFDVHFTIPYEIFGNAAVDKSVTTATFYQGKSGDMLMTADWDVGGVVNPVTLAGNVNNTQMTAHIPKVTTNKVKIPGSGSYLSLTFHNKDNKNAPLCSLLGYDLSVSIENRP